MSRSRDSAGFGGKAFSLLEVVLSMAVFAIIVVPAIGLVALSYRNAETDLQAPNAVEIKSLLELELRGAVTVDGGDTYDVFHESFLSGDVEFYASQDLQTIEQDGAAMSDDEKYYRIVVANPSNYIYDDGDAYRVFLFNIVWPAFVPDSGGGYVSNEANIESLQQLILPTVLSK